MSEKDTSPADEVAYLVCPRQPEAAKPGDYAVSTCISCGHKVRHRLDANPKMPKLCLTCAAGVSSPH